MTPGLRWSWDESHFNVSSVVRDTVTRQCAQTTAFLKRRESRSGIEPRPFCLPAPRLTARPNPAVHSKSQRSGFSPLFTHWLPSAHPIPARQFSSSATTGMGGNSPTTYTLQGSSLKAWVNFHPGRIPRQIWGGGLVFFCISQTYTIFSKHKGGGGGGEGGGGRGRGRE